MPGGFVEVTTDPELDWVDQAILRAWDELNESLCSLCGRPLAVHDDDDPDDYRIAARECAATQALDRFQADPPPALKAADERERKAGRDPERSRTYLTYTDREGPPVR